MRTQRLLATLSSAHPSLSMDVIQGATVVPTAGARSAGRLRGICQSACMNVAQSCPKIERTVRKSGQIPTLQFPASDPKMLPLSQEEGSR